MSVLTYIFTILGLALDAAKLNTTGGVQKGLSLTDALVQIAQAANAAHIAASGQPIDPSKLHQIDPLQ